jgi:hypothetical protein
MTEREDCIKWYGEKDGNSIADHWEAVRKRFAGNPTKIVIPPPMQPYCVECGSDKIRYKTRQGGE